MSLIKRIISVFLAISIVVSMIIVVSAADSNLADTSSVTSWNSYVSSVGDSTTLFWSMMNNASADARVGSFDSLEKLQNAAFIWRKRATTLVTELGLKTDVPYPTVVFDSSYGVYRMQDKLSGNYIVNASGRFAYYCESQDSVPDDYQDQITVSTRQDIWLPFSTAVSKIQVSVLTKDSLSDLCLTLNQTDRTCSVRDTEIKDQAFYVIIDSYNNIYANADGCPYVAHYDKTVTDQKFDYIVNEGDTVDNSTVIDNSQVIDMSNGTFNYIDESGKQEFFIDELVYDMSTQSYSSDTYTITYNNDTYTTNNFTWNTVYNITNVYITNIGQTELYEPLELYYVLPDGRSSADLTAEEVAGISFEFADCVNYAKSATDTYLRALYHFDGNTDDSSYFSTQGSFDWISGASITYMDVGTFEGALYMGPEEHQFQVTLPSNIGSGDFTVQFRYYQEGAADTQNNIENSLAIGGVTVLQWDESYLYSQTSTTACASLGIGSWSEIAVIRSSGTTYLYYNGLNIASFIDSSVYIGTITLTLGDTTRASSMIDELRVINFALAVDGESYTCTSVPYDTNSVLVLPDSSFPIADEYMDISSTASNIYSKYGLDDWADMAALNSGYFTTVTASNSSGVIGFESGCVKYHPYFCVPDFVDVISLDGISIATTGTAYDKSTYYLGGYDYYGGLMPNGLYSVVAYGYMDEDWERDYTSNVLTVGSTYTFSMVASDGSVGSYTFMMPSLSYTSEITNGTWISYIEFNGYRIGLVQFYTNAYYNISACALAIIPVPSDGSSPGTTTVCTGGEFVYLELTEAASTDLSAEWVTCMYSSEEVQPNTAAIQTDIPIIGYTVGGVRPTFPVRGDVWMPVSNNRITNVYVYNGSAWEEVNARWYTGSRWIPIYAFDITTLEDCWDIADIDTVVSVVGSEQEFWNWWKRAWTDFRSWLSESGLGGGSNVDADDKVVSVPGAEDDPETEEDESEDGYSFLDLAGSLVEAVWNVVTGAVKTAFDGISGVTSSVQYISNFFQFYDDGEIYQTVTYTGEGSIWD